MDRPAGNGMDRGVVVSGDDELRRLEWETLRVAFERWRRDPFDQAAAEVVILAIPRIAQTLSSFSREMREAAVDRATEEVYHRIHAGMYPEPIERPWGFLRRLLYWRMLSLSRPGKERAPRGDDKPERSSPLHDAEVAALLERLVESAIDLREERYKAELATAWATCKRWHHGPATLHEINQHDCALLGIDAADDVKTAYNRLTRPQSRMRKELLGVLDEMASWSPPPLDETERDILAEAVPRLARCPKPRGDASTAKGTQT